MAQTLPSSSDPSPPLPRYERKRGGATKAPRPRFQAADGILALLFSAAFVGVFLSTHHGLQKSEAVTGLLALTAATTYLLGWRCGGRTCGVIAGSLTAFSLSLVKAAPSLETALLVLLTLAALFAFACDAAFAACALAGIAAAVRPDGLLLGLILLAVIPTRTRHQFLGRLGAFLGALLIGTLVRLFVLHVPISVPQFFPTLSAISWLLAPAQALVIWMLIPLCAELTDPARRGRWLPTALWSVLALLVSVFIHFGDMHGTLLPLMPIIFVLAAGGLARLIPSLAGDIPSGRYVLATLAVTALLFLRAHTEWTQPPVSVQPAMAAAPLLTVPPVTSIPTVSMPVPLPAVVLRKHPALYSKALRPIKPLKPAMPRVKPAKLPVVKKPILKPAIALYTLRNGHLVRRTKWAIQWEKTHPQAVP